MATSKDFMEYIIDQLGRAVGAENLSAKKMFGEYALYYLGTTIGLVCDNTLYIKITPATSPLLEGHETGFPYPGAKPWYQLEESDLDNQELLRELIEAIYETPQTKKSRPRRSL